MDDEDALETLENEVRPIDDRPLIEKLRKRMALDFMTPPTNFNKFAPPEELSPDRPAYGPLIMPEGDAAQLLENQLSSSAALIAYLAQYIARDDAYSRV